MKWILSLFAALLALVVLVAGGAFIFLASFDANNHKDRIAAALSDATGRAVTIHGDISATLFPVLGFQAGAIELAQPPGFGSEPFLQITAASAGVRLAPLLQNRIELTEIILNEPQINIIKRADGTTNLDFDRRDDARAARRSEQALTIAEDQDRPAMDLRIGQIRISNARASYDDRAAGRQYQIAPLNMTMPGFVPGQDTELALDMVISGDADTPQIQIDANGRLRAAHADGHYTMEGFRVDALLSGANLAAPLRLSLRGDAALDMNAQSAALSNLRARWNGTDITGQATIKDFSRPDIQFALNAPRLDFDALTAAPDRSSRGGGGGSGNRSGAGVTAPQSADFPSFDFLQTATANGTVNIGTIRVAGLSLSDFQTTIALRNGTLQAEPLALNLYDGTFRGRASLRAATPPAFTAAGQLSGIAAGKLLRDIAGEDYVTGQFNADFDLRGSGRNSEAVKRSAAGYAALNFGEGYIQKWQLSQRINQAIAFFETGTLPDSAADRVHFTALSGRFEGSGGVFRNDDLLLRAPRSHATGSGTINLRDNAIDYTLRARLGDRGAAPDDLRQIPIRITGPLNAPRYGIDVEALLTGAAAARIEQKGQELMGRALEKLGIGLPGFGAPPAHPEPAP